MKVLYSIPVTSRGCPNHHFGQAVGSVDEWQFLKARIRVEFNSITLIRQFNIFITPILQIDGGWGSSRLPRLRVRVYKLLTPEG